MTIVRESIHQRLKNELCGRIRQLRPDTKFATEHELCTEFGVSRMTVNKVITELSREGWLYRRRPSGTFVKSPPLMRPLVTFMLPCADFLTMANSSAAILRTYMKGALKAAGTLGARIETLALSPDNDRDHLDLDSLAHLNSSSRVLVVSAWGRDGFAALNHTGAKVCRVDNQNFLPEPYREHVRRWQLFELDRRDALRRLLLRLYEAGKRRIALIAPWLSVPEHPYLRAYEELTTRLGLPKLIYESHEMPVAALRQGIRDYYAACRFDAMLCLEDLFYPESRLDLGLPEEVCMAGLPGLTSELFPICASFDYEKIGAEAVAMLLNREVSEPVIYKADIR